jgi:hypothetical protein
LIPVHEHQIGGGFEKFRVGSQFWRVERGSWREDFRERRERSCRGGVLEQRINGDFRLKKMNVGIRRKRSFMV